MKKLWRWLFFRNDWYTIWTDRVKWNITKRDGYEFTRAAVYEIQYSPLRNDYRVVCSGYDPKEHGAYQEVIELFMEYKSRVPEWKVFNARKHELNYN